MRQAFGHLLVSKRCFAIEEDHGIIKEAKPDTFFQAVGEILPMRARHPYITPPFFCRRECRLLRRNYSLTRLLST
jgi:hypothetical protein